MIRAPRPADAPTTDERELLERVRRGDRVAFTALVSRHGGAVLRFATSFVKERSLAEDVVQEAWLSAFENLKGFEGRAAFRTWLFHIVANKARTRLKREGRSVPFSSLEVPDDGGDPAVSPDRFDERGGWREPPGAWSDENPERLAEGVETRAIIERAIADLPEAQRAVITLRDIEGLETEEICDVLGVTVSNQRVLLHRARSKVRQSLEKYLAGAR